LNALTKGTTYDEITLNQLRKVLIPYPPDLEEQRAIVEILDNIQSKINKEQNQYNKLQEMKKGLMQDLLTGKVRTHDKDIEVLDEVLQHE
jgi:type I restriction enzyme S subunit